MKMRMAFVALATTLTAGLGPSAAAAGAAAGLPPESPARTIECDDAAGGIGAAPPGAARAGPFRMLGKGEVGAHWNPAARRFASKVPVVVYGPRPVDVRVPARLQGRLALVYGSPGGREPAGEVTFVPCARRRATFFPGGLVFTRREPISLLVQPEGRARPKPLNLGVFPPY